MKPIKNPATGGREFNPDILKNDTETAANHKGKSAKTITLIGKYGSKILISAEEALKYQPSEPLYKQAEKQNEENIAEHTITNYPC